MPYLDHAATTPVLPVAAAAVAAQYGLVGNASSLHAAGRRARRVVEESREIVAAELAVSPIEVVFTSGGTEADNLAVKGLFAARRAADPRRHRVLASAAEHHAVMDPVQWLADERGATVHWLPVDGRGRVEPAAVEELLATHADEVALVAVMWASNEVGTMQPIDEIAAACAAYGVPLHTDAVQAVGHLPVDAGGVATLALSAHKLGGPPGTGALVVRRGTDLVPLLHGGKQEAGLRSGTLDVPGVAGLAAALAAETLREDAPRLAGLRDRLEAGLRAVVPDAVVNGDLERRLPGISHVTFPGCEGDALLLLLDAQGIECSTGSACASGVPQPSHVLLAMGVDPTLAKSSLRFSLGHTSTDGDVDALLDVLPAAVARARRAGQTRTPTPVAV